MTLQCPDFRREDDVFAGDTIIERLFAEPVADEENGAGSPVAIGKGEHSVDPLDRATHPFATYEVEKDFGIGMVAQRRAEAPQLGGEGPIPVYFSIVDKGVSRAFVDARLRATGDVDYGQPRMAQSDASVDKDAIAIGSAMAQCGIHSGKDIARIRVRIGEPRNAAHQPTTFSPLL
jgi:hypothetical protein